jgi:hypothetical protein
MFFKRKGLISVGSIPKKLNKNLLNIIEDWEWKYNTQRQETFSQHKDTETILLRFKPPWILDLEKSNRYSGEQYYLHTYPSFSKYQSFVSDYLNLFSKKYRISDYGCMIVKLKSGGYIPPHIDTGNYFINGSRIHVPIKTSRKALFYLDDKKINMKVGKFYQIDNTNIEHSVSNDGSDDRIHIIFDLF